MHLKNFSLLTDKFGKIRLSPAYDLLSTRLLIPVKEDNEELVLSVHEKNANLKLTDFNFLAENLKIPKNPALFMITNLLEKKEKMLGLIFKSFLPKKMQVAFMELLTHRSKILEEKK